MPGTQRPWLTVVTVVRNDAEALRTTLASVACQDHGLLEHLVVDGASTDGTTELARAAAADNPTVRVLSQPDSGIYDAMNKGIAAARGEYLQFVNAGDHYRSCEEVSWLFENAAGTASGWIRTRVRFVDAAGRPTRPLEPGAIDAARFTRGRQPVFHQGALMTRELLDSLDGFDTRYTIVADFDLMRRALARGITPAVFERITVDVDAAGISTLRWRRALWEMHACRTAGGSRAERMSSWLSTVVGVARVGTRRLLRRGAEAVAGEARVAQWRGGRGIAPATNHDRNDDPGMSAAGNR